MRPHRIQQDEYPYHVTTRTNGRKFRLKKSTYRIFIRTLLDTVQRFNVHIQHFKLMDNHYFSDVTWHRFFHRFLYHNAN